MTTKNGELTAALLAALRDCPGVRPSVPETQHSWLPWDIENLAVDVTPDTVTIRLVALTLPLPPLLNHTGKTLRAILDATPWHQAQLHLVITDIDARALPPQG